MDAPKNCDCIAEKNAAMVRHGVSLHTVGGGVSHERSAADPAWRVILTPKRCNIVTQLLDSADNEAPAHYTASFCPFCGTKYPEAVPAD